MLGQWCVFDYCLLLTTRKASGGELYIRGFVNSLSRLRLHVARHGYVVIRTKVHIGAYNYWGTNVRTAATYILGGFCTAVRLVGARFACN